MVRDILLRPKMTEQEVKKRIGKQNWQKFLNWMTGQTCGLYPDGSIDFYVCDVDAFIEKMQSGYDRQKDFKAWD